MVGFFKALFRRKRADQEVKAEPQENIGVPLDQLDRRRWPRVPVELRVRVRFATAAAAVRSRTFDISPGGVFIHMESPRPVGTQVRLVLDVGDRTLQLTGVVARVADAKSGDGLPGIGVRFTELAPDDERFLAELAASDR